MTSSIPVPLVSVLLLASTACTPSGVAPAAAEARVTSKDPEPTKRQEPAVFDGYPDCDLISRDELFTGVCPLIDLVAEHMDEPPCLPREFRREQHPLPIPGLRYYVGSSSCTDSPPTGCFELNGDTVYCRSAEDLSRMLKQTRSGSKIDAIRLRWLVEEYFFDGIYEGPTQRIQPTEDEPGRPFNLDPPATCKTSTGGSQIEYSRIGWHDRANLHLRIEPDGSVVRNGTPLEHCP